MATNPDNFEKIDIGRVLSKGFGALKENIGAFFGVSILLGGVPSFLTYYLAFRGVGTLDFDYLMSLSFLGPVTGAGLAMLIANALLQGILLRSTILHLSGREPDVGASLTLAIRMLLPIIGVTICMSVLVGLGLIALIVPGVMVYCATIVAVPVLIEERQGVFDSISRSWELTKGTRGRIFLLAVVLGIVNSIFGKVADVITGTGSGFDPVDGPLPDPLLVASVEAVVGTITAAIGAAVVAALYVELRQVREGTGTEELAGVFA